MLAPQRDLSTNDAGKSSEVKTKKRPRGKHLPKFSKATVPDKAITLSRDLNEVLEISASITKRQNDIENHVAALIATRGYDGIALNKGEKKLLIVSSLAVITITETTDEGFRESVCLVFPNTTYDFSPNSNFSGRTMRSEPTVGIHITGEDSTKTVTKETNIVEKGLGIRINYHTFALTYGWIVSRLCQLFEKPADEPQNITIEKMELALQLLRDSKIRLKEEDIKKLHEIVHIFFEKVFTELKSTIAEIVLERSKNIMSFNRTLTKLRSVALYYFFLLDFSEILVKNGYASININLPDIGKLETSILEIFNDIIKPLGDKKERKKWSAQQEKETFIKNAEEKKKNATPIMAEAIETKLQKDLSTVDERLESELTVIDQDIEELLAKERKAYMILLLIRKTYQGNLEEENPLIDDLTIIEKYLLSGKVESHNLLDFIKTYFGTFHVRWFIFGDDLEHCEETFGIPIGVGTTLKGLIETISSAQKPKPSEFLLFGEPQANSNDKKPATPKHQEAPTTARSPEPSKNR